MKKSILSGIAALCLFFIFMVGTGLAFQVITQEMMEKEIVTEADLIRTVDNFIILFDNSSSANQMLPGRDVTRIQASKAMLRERNAWLPDLGFNAGLFNMTNTGFEEVYPILPYNRDAFGAAIEKLPETGSGPTMLQQTLSALRQPVAGLTGRTAIILFTDGSYSNVRGPNSALQIAKEIARDNDVCFYLISSAAEGENQRVVDATAQVNACSRVVPLEAFLDNPQYLAGGLFTVKTTTWARLTPVTQVSVEVDNVLFDFGSADLPAGSTENLDQLSAFLQTNPDAFVVAAGYTDSIGDEEYNLGLSQRRVNAVRDHLVKAGIDADRIVTHWYGELNPVGDNATEAGRALNRRVEIAVGAIN